MNRIYEFWIGEQAGGKTYRLKSRIWDIAQLKKVHSVFVFDTMGGFDTDVFPGARLFYSFGEYLSVVLLGPIPVVCIFQFGENPEPYQTLFHEACRQGNICIVLDEAYEFAPGGSTWRGGDTLKKIMLAGRHIRNIEGKECQIHLLMATQYAKTLHHLMWGQANTIYCSKLQGENSRKWLSGNFGADKLDENQKLEMWQWQCVRPPLQKVPRLAPHLQK